MATSQNADISLQPQSDESPAPDSRVTVSIFCSVLGLVIAAMYFLGRTGLPGSMLVPLVKVISAINLIVFLPHGYRMLCGCLGRTASRSWLGAQAAHSLLGLVLLTLPGLVFPRSLGIFLVAFCFLANAIGLMVFVDWLRRAKWTQSVGFLGASVLFSLWCAARIFGANYHDPLFVEGIMVGRVHLDELIVAATTSMITTYGVPSTGLDGIPYYAYHWGSWWIFAQMAKFLNMRVVDFIQMGYPTIFVPYLYYTLLVLAIDIQEKLRRFRESFPERPLRANTWFWTAFFVPVVGFLPGTAGVILSLYPSGSESYGVSLSLAFVLFSLGLTLVEYAGHDAEPMGRQQIILLILVMPLLLAGLALTKVSTGFLACVIIGYLFLRHRLYRSWIFCISIALGAFTSIAAVINITAFANVASQGSFFHPFHYLSVHVTPALRPYFFFLHYFWSLTFLAAVLVLHYRTKGRQPVASAAFPSWDFLEILLFTAIVGALPGLLFSIGGGSAIYFSHVQIWLAVAFLLGFMETIRSDWNAPGRQAGNHSELRFAGRHRLRTFLPALALILMFAAILPNGMYTVAYAVYRNVSLRLCMLKQERVVSNVEVGCGGKQWAKDLYKALRAAGKQGTGESLTGVLKTRVAPLFSNLGPRLEKAERYEILGTLRELSARSAAEKRKTLVFIPQSNKLYWDLINPNVTGAFGYPACKAAPFIAPAVTEMAMIDGMPQKECDLYAFGYYAYQKRTRDQTPADTLPEALCSKAASKGFSKVIAIDAGPDSRVVLRLISCE